MANKKYFRNIPDFDYISRLPGGKNISDYVKTKNLFKRAKIRDDIFEDITYFVKYKISGDDRPDNVAFDVYRDSNLDWLVMLSNNIINLANEWPLTQRSFNNYCLNKYGSYENLYDTHHYETQEVRDSRGDVILEQGIQVPQNYSITFFDVGIGTEILATGITNEVTNLDYEEKIQDDKANIFVLNKRDLSVVLNDISNIMPYKEGSTQYVNSKLVKGENSRLY